MEGGVGSTDSSSCDSVLPVSSKELSGVAGSPVSFCTELSELPVFSSSDGLAGSDEFSGSSLMLSAVLVSEEGVFCAPDEDGPEASPPNDPEDEAPRSASARELR